MIPIYIDLSNGDAVQDDIEAYNKLTTQERFFFASMLLGHRIAARGIFGCSYSVLVRAVHQQLDILNLFNFHAVMQFLGRLHKGNQNSPVGILLILDEINYLFNYPNLAKIMTAMIGNYMCGSDGLQQQDDGVVLFPVISGTAVYGVRNTFQASSFGNTFISLEYLKYESAKSIFEGCLPDKKNFLEDKRMARLLLLYGSTPSVLAHIILVAKDMTKLDDSNFATLVQRIDAKVNKF